MRAGGRRLGCEGPYGKWLGCGLPMGGFAYERCAPVQVVGSSEPSEGRALGASIPHNTDKVKPGGEGSHSHLCGCAKLSPDVCLPTRRSREELGVSGAAGLARLCPTLTLWSGAKHFDFSDPLSPHLEREVCGLCDLQGFFQGPNVTRPVLVKEPRLNPNETYVLAPQSYGALLGVRPRGGCKRPRRTKPYGALHRDHTELPAERRASLLCVWSPPRLTTRSITKGVAEKCAVLSRGSCGDVAPAFHPAGEALLLSGLRGGKRCVHLSSWIGLFACGLSPRCLCPLPGKATD